jgi:hypothetical protein
MHLREARIDLGGQVAAVGWIEYVPDEAGYFPLPNHHCVRVSKFGTRLRLAPATSERDYKTNFLDSREVGPVVFVPESLGVVIQGALRTRLESSIEIHLADQQETLESCGNREISKKQPLSDWRLRISTIGGTLRIKLSAALQATKEIPVWDKSAGNFWKISNSPVATITIEFEVDEVTRILFYGYLGSGSFDDAPAAPIEPNRSTLLDMKLDNAPVSRMGRLFGYAPRGGWMSFYDNSLGGIIIGQVRLKRYPDGFVADTSDPSWPRIWLEAFDMNALIRAVRSTLKLTIELQDGYFGHLQQHHSFYECYEPSPEQSIQRARLNLQLDLFGLSLAYNLFIRDLHPSSRGKHMSGWLQGQLILPWELLIIRYPVLSYDRAKILAAHNNVSSFRR